MRAGLAFMDAALAAAADERLPMDEDAFRAFYDRTARQVWAVLYRGTRNGALADDLLQESYYRLLRVRGPFESDAHRVHYLFRIASNLVADARRRRPEPLALDHEHAASMVTADPSPGVERRADVERALATLAPRDRDLLWLAYADGASHQEIAQELGLRRPSIKVMLSRARRRLADRLRQAGAYCSGGGKP